MVKDSEIIDALRILADERVNQKSLSKETFGFRPYASGLFSVVFRLLSDNEMLALKCWRIRINDCKRRYQLLTDYSWTFCSNYLSPFDYIDEGLCIEGRWYPILWMRWIDGIPLKTYLQRNYLNANAVELLINQFGEMCNHMFSENIAHGDMQSDNIIIDKRNNIHLLDYDSMFVPSMNHSFRDFMNGLADYQHPARSKNILLSKKIDYFSDVVIYLSLLAVLYKPYLVEKYLLKEASCSLLFHAYDFLDLPSSEIYSDIKAIGEPVLLQYLDYLTMCLSIPDINDLPQPIL